MIELNPKSLVTSQDYKPSQMKVGQYRDNIKEIDRDVSTEELDARHYNTRTLAPETSQVDR